MAGLKPLRLGCFDIKIFALVSLSLFFSWSAHASTWYVDGKNGLATNAGTLAAPFSGPQQAMAVAKPGDTIYLLPTTVYAGLAVTSSGTAGLPVTVAGAGVWPNLTRIATDGTASAVWINANFVKVTGFDATAPGQNAAFSIQQNRHHVTIANNIAHDSGAAGIRSFSNDYIQIVDNTVYGNAFDTAGNKQGSGITMLGALDIDSNTGTKNVINGNIVYANTNTPNCSNPACYKYFLDSDGNGIILDTFLRDKFDNIPYHGRTLISNNIVYGNGGRGIWVYATNHVSISGNTVWSNNQDPYEGAWHPGEIGLLRAGDVMVADNIVYSDGKTGRNPTGTAPNTHFALIVDTSINHQGPIVLNRNLLYNPQNDPSLNLFVRRNTDPIVFTDNIWADPKLVALSLDPTKNDFRPRAGSPVLNNGNPATAVMYDVLWSIRTGNTSIGAYERPAP